MLIIILRVLSFVASYEAGYAVRWLMVHKAMYLAMAAEKVGFEEFSPTIDKVRIWKSLQTDTESHGASLNVDNF